MLLYAIFAGFGLSVLAVAIGAWLPRRKKLPDWLMVAGGTLAVIAFAGLLLAMFGYSLIGRVRQDLWIPMVSAGIGAGSLLFAMGYVMDRLGRRKAEGFDDGLK